MKLTIKILIAALAFLPCSLSAQSPGSFSTLSATTYLLVGSGNSISGTGSMAIGYDAIVTGEYSAGIGYGVSVTGSCAFAVGEMATASNWASVALNYGNASGDASAAFNGSYAIGWESAAVNLSTAAGGASFAQGMSTVGGHYAAGFGLTTVPSAYSVAIGQYNAVVDSSGGSVSGTTWDPVDPLLSVGIGTSPTARKDAFTIYKDGKIRMTKRQGDIIMGEFGDGNGD